MIESSILNKSNFYRFNFPIILACLLCCGLYLYFFAFKAQVEIDINILDQEQTTFKIYWAEKDRGFTEQYSNEIILNQNNTSYSLLIGDLGNIEQLRIDPTENVGRVNIHRINIKQIGYDTLNLDTVADFQRLEPSLNIEPPAYKNNTIELRTTAGDNQLLLPIGAINRTSVPFVHLFNLLLISILAAALCRLINISQENLSYVPYLLFGALALALIMASISTFNVHPDEKAHFLAVDYYSDHLLPPAVDDPNIADTFSDFGKSRLSFYEAYYQLAGYFTRLLEPFQLSKLLDTRLFNVSLFGILLIVSIRNCAFRCFTLPLLITPQAWYLFSYVNSDAMGLFLTILMSYQAAVKTSLLNKYLSEDSPPHFWLSTITLGMLCGCLILLKPNYYFFILFLGIYLAWRMGIGDFPDKKRLMSRLGLLLLIGLVLPGIRYGLDIKANGFNSSEKYEQMTEQKSDYWYKPSTPLEEKHIHLYLKDRGMPLDHILHIKRWTKRMLANSFGSYGYTQFNPSRTTYEIIRTLCIVLFFTMLLSVLINGPPSSHVLFGVTIFSAVLLLGVSLWSSWTIVFQPQGRYLAPILAMSGILYYHIKSYLFSRIFHTLVIAMFSLSVYSFIFIGLRSVAKTSFAYG